MRTAVVLIVAIHLGIAALAFGGQSESSCWSSGDEGLSEYKECLESYGKNGLRIKPDILPLLQFKDGFATVHNDKRGWLVVNPQGVVVVEGVMAMDNAADEVRDGFVRFTKNGKCGYAALGGKASIPARFDGCMPFENGRARVCVGCRIQAMGEVHQYTGGKWHCIGVNGQRVACGK